MCKIMDVLFYIHVWLYTKKVTTSYYAGLWGKDGVKTILFQHIVFTVSIVASVYSVLNIVQVSRKREFKNVWYLNF